MILFAMLLLGTLSPANEADVLFPSGEKVMRLRVVVTVDGRSPEAAWSEFLDKLFDYFDRDSNRSLSKAEAARVFPLPLPGGREARVDFAKLDANGDGKATRTEFQAFYRAAGFTPVVVVIRPPAAEHRRLSDALFQHLDRDGDGRLTRAELEKAPALLRRLDENEDEILTAAELLALESTDPLPPSASVLKTAPREGTADATVHLALAKNGAPPKIDGNLGAARLTVVATSDNNALRTAKGFYLAQFFASLGNKPSLSRADLESDPSLQTVAAMFDVADRDGDEKLTEAELRTFLDLIELGAGCQAVVAFEDRGGNLLDLLDTDRDGTLDLAELNRAARVCADVAAWPLTRESIPQQLRLSVSRGPVGSVFGPVPLPSAPAPKLSAPTKAARGPKWFQSMDKNGDGFVSVAEFIGPPELFRKLDSDGDGRISAIEATITPASR